MGYDGIPEKYKENIELKSLILTVADDMVNGCDISAYHPAQTVDEKRRERRYIYAYPTLPLEE